jgi:hypothetical protein
MTESEYKAAHIALWQWLYDNPERSKGSWPGWEVNGGEHGACHNDCFACELCWSNHESCEKCPLSFRCHDDGSPYKEWDAASTRRTRKKYAAIIRDAWREIPQ